MVKFGQITMSCNLFPQSPEIPLWKMVIPPRFGHKSGEMLPPHRKTRRDWRARHQQSCSWRRMAPWIRRSISLGDLDGEQGVFLLGGSWRIIPITKWFIIMVMLGSLLRIGLWQLPSKWPISTKSSWRNVEDENLNSLLLVPKDGCFRTPFKLRPYFYLFLGRGWHWGGGPLRFPKFLRRFQVTKGVQLGSWSTNDSLGRRKLV